MPATTSAPMATVRPVETAPDPAAARWRGRVKTHAAREPQRQLHQRQLERHPEGAGALLLGRARRPRPWVAQRSARRLVAVPQTTPITAAATTYVGTAIASATIVSSVPVRRRDREVVDDEDDARTEQVGADQDQGEQQLDPDPEPARAPARAARGCARRTGSACLRASCAACRKASGAWIWHVKLQRCRDHRRLRRLPRAGRRLRGHRRLGRLRRPVHAGRGLRRARDGHLPRPRGDPGVVGAHDDDVPGPGDDRLPAELAGRRRRRRAAGVRGAQPDAGPGRRHHARGAQHHDHDVRRRRALLARGGRLQPAALPHDGDGLGPDRGGARPGRRRRTRLSRHVSVVDR